jgi:hypothetical protein
MKTIPERIAENFARGLEAEANIKAARAAYAENPCTDHYQYLCRASAEHRGAAREFDKIVEDMEMLARKRAGGNPAL